MGLQCRTRTSLLDLLESHAGANVPKKAVQPKPLSLPSTHASQLDPADKKWKLDQKRNKVIEEKRTAPTKEAEPQRGGKHAKIT